ncbi:MAG: hypothetical protein AB8H80_01365 [Planctomycetota bacterium]
MTHPDVLPLWSLFEACRRGSAEARLAAAQAVVEALAEGRAPHRLEVEHGLLCADGVPMPAAAAATLVATHELCVFLRDFGVVGLCFGGATSVHDLLEWVGSAVRGDAQVGSPDRVSAKLVSPADVSNRCLLTPDQAVPKPVAPSEPSSSPDAERPVASRLTAMFVQQRLLAAAATMPTELGIDPASSRLVLAAIVDRLLAMHGGQEAVMMLQDDEELLRRSVALAVLVTMLARRAGWPSERLVDVGAVALLHDVGCALDPQRPGPAAFRWLLRCGQDDFWLRCAIVARAWHDPNRRRDEGDELLTVKLLRAASDAYVALAGRVTASAPSTADATPPLEIALPCKQGLDERSEDALQSELVSLLDDLLPAA